MKHLISAAIALTLLGSPAALAQRDNPNHQGQNPTPFQNPAQVQNNAGPGGPQGFNQFNRDQPHFSRGDRLPDQYRQNQYVVSDWRGHHLRKPPRGHHWVRVNDRYVLVAITSGLILSAILNSR
ncbi:MAG: RcnB family protein [Rhizomicrobium sp.]|jgi:Ni/Co efflux regulator RcnB